MGEQDNFILGGEELPFWVILVAQADWFHICSKFSLLSGYVGFAKGRVKEFEPRSQIER